MQTPLTTIERIIKKHQKMSTVLSFSKRAFSRLVREIACEMAVEGMEHPRFQAEAIVALQESAEKYLVCMFEKSNKLAIHTKRTTVTVKDMQFHMENEGPDFIGNGKHKRHPSQDGRRPVQEPLPSTGTVADEFGMSP
jgi:histone H3/H4